jgi:hypothetical protein
MRVVLPCPALSEEARQATSKSGVCIDSLVDFRPSSSRLNTSTLRRKRVCKWKSSTLNVFTKGTYYSEYEMLAWVVQELLFVDCIGCSRAYRDDLVSHFSDV